MEQQSCQAVLLSGTKEKVIEMKRFKVSIDKESWQKGYDTGKRREPDMVPENVEVLSWHSGYIEGKALTME